MNRKIIKKFKLNIYNTNSPNNPQKYTKDILYYILLYYIYLIILIVKKLSKKQKKKYETQRKR